MVFHVLNRANARARIFAKHADYAAFERVMRETSARKPMRVLGYLIMPNHWHLVVEGLEQGSVSSYMRWVTGTHVRRYHRFYSLDGTGHLYQGRYTSVPVQGDVHFLVVLRYVEANPLRAGLVRRAQDWPWSSLGAPDAVRSQLVVDGPVPRPANWVELVNEPLVGLGGLRQSIARGRPIGSDLWTAETARQFGLQFTMRPPGRPRKRRLKPLILNAGGSFC